MFRTKGLFPDQLLDDPGAAGDQEVRHFKPYLLECLESETKNVVGSTSQPAAKNLILSDRVVEEMKRISRRRRDLEDDAVAVKPQPQRTTTKSTDSFPLQDATLFWSSFVSCGGGGDDAKKPENPCVSYVAFDHDTTSGDKNDHDIKVKNRDLLLNKSVAKALDANVAGDQIHRIVPRLGKKAAKKRRRAERENTKGDGWFGMKAPEMTEERKRELQVLQMRSAIDPKRFYKKNEHSKDLPKYFQIGRVVDSPLDYYSNRRAGGSKKKKSLVDELMADAEYQKYSKRKYAEIIEEKARMMPRRKKRAKSSSSR